MTLPFPLSIQYPYPTPFSDYSIDMLLWKIKLYLNSYFIKNNLSELEVSNIINNISNMPLHDITSSSLYHEQHLYYYLQNLIITQTYSHYISWDLKKYVYNKFGILSSHLEYYDAMRGHSYNQSEFIYNLIEHSYTPLIGFNEWKFYLQYNHV